MAPEITAAIIAAIIALLTSIATAGVALMQLRREMKKWKTDFRSVVEVEHLKMRLQHYPSAYAILGELSSQYPEKLTAERATRLLQEINKWFYSQGGLCADKSTRGAIIGLREALASWSEKQNTSGILHWRDLCVFYLRRDIHLHGLEDYSMEDMSSSYEKLKKEMEDFAK